MVGNLKALIRELATKLILTVELNDTLLLVPTTTHITVSTSRSATQSTASQRASQLTKALYLITPIKDPTLNCLPPLKHRHCTTTKPKRAGKYQDIASPKFMGRSYEVFNITILPVKAYSHVFGEKELNLNPL